MLDFPVVHKTFRRNCKRSNWWKGESDGIVGEFQKTQRMFCCTVEKFEKIFWNSFENPFYFPKCSLIVHVSLVHFTSCVCPHSVISLRFTIWTSSSWKELRTWHFHNHLRRCLTRFPASRAVHRNENINIYEPFISTRTSYNTVINQLSLCRLFRRGRVFSRIYRV